MSFIPKMALAVAVPKAFKAIQNQRSSCDVTVHHDTGSIPWTQHPLQPAQITPYNPSPMSKKKTPETQNTGLKWLSKVAALSLETPSAIALINYRFFKQTQTGRASTYTPKFTDYFKGLPIVGPLRVASYSLALGASDVGQSLTRYLWPDSSKETQYMLGGGCSALVGGLLSVPVEGVMVKGMDAIQNQRTFKLTEALMGKPTTSAILATWGREMPYFLGLAVGAKIIAPLLPSAIPETQKENTALVITATGVSYATQPADTIKSKVQQNQWTIRKSIIEISKSGPRGFFVGAVPRLAKVYLNFFVTWVVAAKIYTIASGNQSKTA